MEINEYYDRIRLNEYVAYRNKNIVRFTKRELNEIDKYFKNINQSYFITEEPISDDIKEVLVDVVVVRVGEHGYIFILSMPDEWYLVNHRHSTFYKCDQLDGLFKFLEDRL